jgi:GNAT superfamily N-acetyltransferase
MATSPTARRIIRSAEVADLELLVEMNAEYCAAEGHRHDRERARAGIAPLLEDTTHGSIWVVLDDDGGPIGYGVLAWSWSIEIGGPEAVLDELYVRRRGEGFGSRALEALVHAAWEAGMKRVFMETERPNERARALYRRHGFSDDDSIWLSRVADQA